MSMPVPVVTLTLTDLGLMGGISSQYIQGPVRLSRSPIPVWHRHLRRCHWFWSFRSPDVPIKAIHPISASPSPGIPGHPSPSQPGPVHARFSRGWVEFGVGLSDLLTIGVGFLSPLPPLPPMSTQFDPR